MILIGLGILCERHEDIELYQISSGFRDVRTFSIANDNKKLDIVCSNTVEENLILHGASIQSFNQCDTNSLVDISVMWNICCNGIDKRESSLPYLWNKVTSMLLNLNNESINLENTNSIVVKSDDYKNLLQSGTDGILFDNYMKYFVRMGFLELKTKNNHTYITFKNSQIKNCLTTAGMILELKIYLLCCDLVHSLGGDCLTGVTIDWDGDDDFGATKKYLSDWKDPNSTIDTINEIDILVNWRLTSYFISCKNGRFNSEELYKLSSVCNKFSGGYGKKIIVTTDSIFSLGEARNTLLQRAVDMEIFIIEDIHNKTDEEIKKELRVVMELPKNKSKRKFK
ncbi:hypothetical protein P261_00112 [Lachnospiraceae bacterium TWA4]|nr:hypothetical protein P261_00112 [Lachnospiraceae bacterium TWA4]